MTITCFEQDYLEVGSSGFTVHHFQALVAWGDRNQVPYFTPGNHRIRFNQWVGVLQVGDLTIEILPKAETEREARTADSAERTYRWKSLLLRMLKECHNLDLHSPDLASLSLQRHTILDLIFERFLDHAEQLLEQGLIRRYRMVEKNRHVVKGQINHALDIKHNLIQRQRTFTKASEYDRINIWNRILVHASQVTVLYARSAALRSRAASILLAFPDWSGAPVRPQDFARLQYDRKSEGYRLLNRYAELVLSRVNPDLKGGKSPVFALLFDMNLLWESWVFSRLKRKYRDDQSLTLSAQRSRIFWESGSGLRKTIRPDIVVQRKGRQPLILDTKWKVLSVAMPDDNDLKQLFVYNLLFDSCQSYLLYPQVYGLSTTSGTFSFRASPDAKLKADLAFLDIENPENSINLVDG